MALTSFQQLLHLLLVLQLLSVKWAARIQGPLFIQEPPLKVEFMNDKGATINCIAHGEPEPEVDWLTGQESDQRVDGSGWLRRVYDNGSMVLAPFRSDEYRQDVHGTTYRCAAKNIHGRIVSWPVLVRAAMAPTTTSGQSSNQGKARPGQMEIQAQVYDVYVITGNTAVLTCHVPPFLKDDLKVIAWIREDNYVISRKPNSNRKYAIGEGGKLYVSSVTRQDGGVSYWCRVQHTISNQTVLSSTAGKIVITEPHRNVPLKISDIIDVVQVRSGRPFIILPCVAQGYPPSSYRWYYTEISGKQALMSDNQSNGVLILHNVNKHGTKNYTCMAYNNNNSINRTTRMVVTENLSVQVEPHYLVVDSGHRFRLNCTINGYPINQKLWTLNGQKLEYNDRVKLVDNGQGLIITSASSLDQGMYQCFATNDDDAAQGTAQVRLGAIPPTLVKTFSPRVLQPGPSITLVCASSGHPPPSVTFSRYGKDILVNSKYQLSSDYDDIKKMRTRKLTIRNVNNQDGGEYTCTASNRLGVSTFTGRIDVYGLPVVHPIENVTIATGQDVVVRCHVSGYPIKIIKWRRTSPRRRLPKSGQTNKNGTLILKNVSAEDGGTYKCTANNGRGQRASQIVNVFISRKPEIGTLSSPGRVEAGKLVTMVCTVEDGDEPIRISWTKDDRSLSVDLGIDFMEAKGFSYLQIREVKKEHSGNYTCTAKNSAGQSSGTVNLSVLLPPEWISPPSNKSAIIGTPVVYLNCVAHASPEPVYKWSRPEGEETLKNSSKYLVLSNGTLAVRNIDISDGGSYQCDVSNQIFPDLSGDAILNVGTVPKFIGSDVKYSVFTDDNVTIPCNSTGSQPITISWIKDGRLLHPTYKTSFVIQNKSTKYSTVSQLVFKAVRLVDSGRYICRATNIHGQSTGRNTLVVQMATTTSTTTTTTSTIAHRRTARVTYGRPNQSLKTSESVLTASVTKSKKLSGTDEENHVTESSISEFLYTRSFFSTPDRHDRLNTTFHMNTEIKKMNNTTNGTINSHQGSDMGTHNLTFDDGHQEFSYSIQDLLTHDSWLLYLAPGIAAVILLTAVIATVIVIIATKAPRRSRKLASVISSPIRTSFDSDSCRQKPVPTMQQTLKTDSKYGKLEPSKLWTTGKRLDNGYEIPDYCSGVKPYGTLQLGQFYGRKLPNIPSKSTAEEKQQSL